MALGRPAPRIAGDWLVATMVYASTKEARRPGFDRWYWDLLALLAKTKKLLAIVGAYDSDGTIRELLEEARKRGLEARIHFIERGPLRVAFDREFPKGLASVVDDLDGFADDNGIPLDGDDDLDIKF